MTSVYLHVFLAISLKHAYIIEALVPNSDDVCVLRIHLLNHFFGLMTWM